MQSQLEIRPKTTSDEEARELVARLLSERARTHTPRKPLPGWTRVAMRVLPRLLLAVTLINLFIGLLAVVTPPLRVAFGVAATDWIYSAYSLICPQRPSHTTFIGGEPMAMEQRMVAMYLAFGVVGLLYLCWPRLRAPLPTWLTLAGLAPAAIDVALSTAGIRPSTVDSRLWTGALAALAIVWWAYPRFDAMLRQTRRHVSHGGEQSLPANVRGGRMTTSSGPDHDSQAN
jgi:uncharacterized membrane protein